MDKMDKMDNVGCVPQKESPIEAAQNVLKNIIGETKEIMTGFETKLSAVITQIKAAPTSEKKDTTPQTSLERYLTNLTDEVLEINNHLRSIQNRIQL